MSCSIAPLLKTLKRFLRNTFGDHLVISVVLGLLLVMSTGWTADLVLACITDPQFSWSTEKFVMAGVMPLLVIIICLLAKFAPVEKDGVESKDNSVDLHQQEVLVFVLSPFSYRPNGQPVGLDEFVSFAKNSPGLQSLSQALNATHKGILEKTDSWNWYPLFKVIEQLPAVRTIIVITTEKSQQEWEAFKSLFALLVPRHQSLSLMHHQDYPTKMNVSEISDRHLNTLRDYAQTLFTHLDTTHEPQKVSYYASSGTAAHTAILSALAAAHRLNLLYINPNNLADGVQSLNMQFIAAQE